MYYKNYIVCNDNKIFINLFPHETINDLDNIKHFYIHEKINKNILIDTNADNIIKHKLKNNISKKKKYICFF